MTRRKLRALATGVVASLAALIGAAGVGAAPASAAITTGLPAPYVTTSPSSDPDAELCTYNGVQGYCLYTSQDINQGKDGYGNYYPMNQTLGYFSSNGLSWQYIGVVLTEQQYVNHGWVPNANVRHLWAPTQAYGNGYSFMYVPDVSDPSHESTSSFIGVSVNTADKPFGPFTPVAQIRGDPNVNGGYASDPNILNYGTDHYLTYANGDDSNCGGLSITEMQTGSMIYTGPKYSIPISGLSAFGDCGTGHPYMEGASLYYTPNWGFGPFGLPGPFLLEFALKPTTYTPAECQGNGEPSTPNEVIAYATASTLDPGDPTWTGFQYQGILMCGSSTEWTDQASILPVRTNTGDIAPVLIYHDATDPGPGHNRTLHAECLMYGGGKFAGAMRTGGTNFTDGGGYQCVNNFDQNAAVLAPTQSPYTQFNGQLITAPSNGTAMSAARRFAGPGERADFLQNGLASAPHTPVPIKYSIYYSMPYTGVAWSSQSNNDYVTAPATYSKLAANSPYITQQGIYDVHFYGDGTVTILSENVNRYVQTQADGTLQATTLASGNPEHYLVMHY